MLKKSLLISLGVLLAQGAFAETLSPEAALQRAEANNGARRKISAAAKPVLAYTAKTIQGQPAVYVFNQEAGGTILVSASDLALPVLGYFDSGTFDSNLMPPQFKAWLDSYAAQIAYAEENGLSPVSKNATISYPSDWKFVAPLVKTKWDQTKPYNNDLKYNYYATGCVATAMAQVMNFHKYPEIGHGSNTYKDAYGTTYSMDFAEKPFDWANMIDDYSTTQYTAEQASAVAYLMKACGYSTNMNYGTQSGTQVENAGKALPTYFGYDDGIEALQRYGYTNSEWAALLYDQLTNYGPVIYSGHSLGGFAHAFVADGYDGQGYFHINWGWSGMCDGFYSIDALVPSAQGTGGSNYGGYNFSQGMIINIKPSEGTPNYSPKAEMTLLGNISGENTSSILTLTMTTANPGNLCNNSLASILPVLGICMENEATGAKTYAQATGVYFYAYANQNATTPTWIQFNLTEFGPGSYIDPKMSVKARFDSSLPDGKYKVQLVWRDSKISPDWQNFIIANGCHDYIYVTKTGNSYSIENLPMARLNFEQAEITTPLYMNSPCQIRLKVSNPSDVELSQSFVPVLFYDGNASFEGDSQLVTVAPKQTITTDLVYTFSTKISGGTSPTTSTPREYTLGAYDYGMMWEREYASGEYGESYYGNYGTVTMKRNTTSPTIQGRGISIDNAEESGMNQEYGYLYGINNFSDILLSAKVSGKSGFVASPLSVVVTEYDPENPNSMTDVVYEKNFEDLMYIESGEEKTFSTYLHMDGVDFSKVYAATIYYMQGNTRSALGSARFAASSGVGEILTDGNLDLRFDGINVIASSDAGLKAVTVYDLSCKTVVSPACNGVSRAEVNMSALSQGIYIVKAVDAAGNSKTLKLRF